MSLIITTMYTFLQTYGACTFLVPDKKSTKRNRLGGGVVAKSIDATKRNQHFYLDSEPPSPQTPLPA